MKPWLPVLLLAACSWKYRPDHPAAELPQLRITEVKVARGSTKLEFVYRAEESRNLGVHPPGHEGAFRITTVDGKHSWELEKVSGIATLPERTPVAAGETLDFTLTFEAIPESLRLFDVVEGAAAEGETSWRFHEVRLRARHDDAEAASK